MSASLLKNKAQTFQPSKAVAIRKKIAGLEKQADDFYRKIPDHKIQTDKIKDTIKNDIDSMSEMGETESLRLQMAMDRMSKLMSTLSNLLKKISDTANTITQNLK